MSHCQSKKKSIVRQELTASVHMYMFCKKKKCNYVFKSELFSTHECRHEIGQRLNCALVPSDLVDTHTWDHLQHLPGHLINYLAYVVDCTSWI